MKRYVPTLVLVILCIGAFWYASSQNFFKEEEEVKAPLVTLQAGDAQSFSIKSGDASPIELARKDSGWAMTQPSPIPVNGFSADGWLEAFAGVTADKTIEENASDLAKYGLDTPIHEFKAKLKNGSEVSLQVGDPMAISGYYYAKTGGSNKVVQVGEQQLTSLAVTQMDFLNANPFQFDADKIVKLNAEWKGQKWVLTKNEPAKSIQDSAWKLGDKELKGVDAAAIPNHLLFNMMTQELTKPAEQVPIPDSAAVLKIELTETKDGKDTVTLYVGKVENDTVWLKKQDGGWAYALPAASVDEWFNKGKQ